jgi:hypothetical protein
VPGWGEGGLQGRGRAQEVDAHGGSLAGPVAPIRSDHSRRGILADFPPGTSLTLNG